jgi:putative tryptophan/tyrosine transport system substrate-binding protein
MKRREFITLLGGAAAGNWPLAVRAQQAAKPARLGYIWIGSKGSEHSTLGGLRQGLSDLGYIEGRDFVIDDRYADSRPERLPGIVAELISTRIDLILSPGNPVTQAAKTATSSIPIISTTPDLLASGFVASLARPGGNVTGMSLTAGAALAEKWVELLHESFPGVKNVAVLSSSSAASSAYLEKIREAASALGMQLQDFSAQNPVELLQALAAMEAAGIDGLVVESDAALLASRAEIIGFAARHRLPTVYGNSDYVPDGGLMSYATSIFESWRRLASYVDRVLRGTSPGTLPVEQATKFDLRVNLRTARILGLVIPPLVLARADDVIE